MKPPHTEVTAAMIFVAPKFSTGLCERSAKLTWRWNVEDRQEIYALHLFIYYAISTEHTKMNIWRTQLQLRWFYV